MIAVHDYWDGVQFPHGSIFKGPTDTGARGWDNLDVCIDNRLTCLIKIGMDIPDLNERFQVYLNGDLIAIVEVDLRNWCLNFEPDYLEGA